MHTKHHATADPDSPVGTTAIRHEHHTNGYRIAFDPETGEATFDEPLPDDRRELQDLAKLWNVDASQSTEAIRESLEAQDGIPDEIAERLADAYDDIEVE